MEIDRLSALPDHLLLPILDRLHSTKEAAKTAVLSKQWRFLWTNLPLKFWDCYKEIDERGRFLARVHAALAARRKTSSTLDYCSLSVNFCYDEGYASDLDALLESASESRVKDVELDLYILPILKKGFPCLDCCSLPQAIYSHSSLTSLSLRSINVVTPATSVEWRFMTELSMSCSYLPQEAIDKIASSCPALSTLKLEMCIGFNRLDVGGRSFRHLDVRFCEGFDCDELLEISAPYMRDLIVWISPRKRSLRLTDVSSLEKVDILMQLFYSDGSVPEEKMVSNGEQLFQQLLHVTSFVLDYGWTEVLSMMRNKGWQFPQSRVEHLKIKEFDEHTISIVLAILESSPFLDKLNICNDLFEKKNINWDASVNADLKCDLLHLKTVRIDVFVDPILSNELTFTLAQILLKRAPALEEMVICKKMANHRDMTDDSTKCIELIEKFETLLTYPKSSQKAIVHISLY